MSLTTFFSNAWRYEGSPEEGTTETVEEKKPRPLLWGREWSASFLTPILPILRPIGMLFSTQLLHFIAFGLGLCALLWGGHVIRQRDGLLPSGPHAFWAKFLSIWFFANLSALVRASVTEVGPGSPKPQIFWRLYLVLPFLKVHNSPYGDADFRKTLRERLSGAAFLWALGLMAVLFLQFSEIHWGNQSLVILASACFFTGLLQLSPWWSSPTRDTLAQSQWGQGFPWPSWHHIWGGLWRDLFGNSPKTDAEKYLTKTSIYILLWTLVGIRATSYLVRQLANQLYIDSLHAGSFHESWLLFVVAMAIMLAGLFVLLSLILLLLIRGTRFVMECFQ